MSCLMLPRDFFQWPGSSLVALLGLALSLSAAAEPLADGVEAYRQGDFVKAMELWRPLAEQGDPEAAFYLSRLYGEGQGVDEDEAEAVYWLKKSAGDGYPQAQFNLGNHYHQGIWVPEVRLLAILWWRRAAAGGYPQAQYNLGRVYYYGLDVDKDEEQAIHWFRLAAKGGSERAREALETLGLEVEPEVSAEDREPNERQESMMEQGPEEASATGLGSEEPEDAGPVTDAASEGAPTSEEWIRRQPSEYYTFQLFAGRREVSALRYLDEWRIPDPKATYSYRRDGEPWTAVLWGSFGDRQQAANGLRDLPAEVTRDVWLRKFGEIQALLPEQP